MRINITLLVTTAALLAGPLSLDALAQGASIKLLDYQTIAPAKWVSRPPTSSARLAMFTVPGSGSASNAEVVVYSFGSTPGGNVAANLERWRSQFSTPDGSPVPEKVTRDSSGAFPVTIAEYRGTYRRGVHQERPRDLARRRRSNPRGPHPEPAGCSRQERWEHGVHGSAGTALTRRRHVDLCRLVTGQGC